MLTFEFCRAVLGTWVKTYTAEVKKAKQPVQIEKIPGAKIDGVWFGDKNKASTIMIYIHGGGYAMPGLDMHAKMLMRWAGWCDGKLAIFAPAYTLTPHGVYPQALSEVIEATRFILEGVGKNKEVMIAGDSAGGQLVLSILSHVSGHQHPETTIVKPLDLKGKKFKSAICIAPWVSSDSNKFPSTHELAYTDMIAPNVAAYWSGLYKNGRKDDEYIVPEIAPASWWSGLGDATDELLATAGDHEVLRDPIKSWYRNVEQGWQGGNHRLVVGEGESHDEPLQPKKLDGEVAGKEKTQEGAIYLRLKELVG
jgi:acetyl esterase/lipase